MEREEGGRERGRERERERKTKPLRYALLPLQFIQPPPPSIALEGTYHNRHKQINSPHHNLQITTQCSDPSHNHTCTPKASPIVCCISNSLRENFLPGNLGGLGVSTGLESSETWPRCMARSAAPLLEGPGPGGSEAALRSVISACCPNAMAVVSFEHTKLKAVLTGGLGPLSSVALKVNSFLKPNSTVFA